MDLSAYPIVLIIIFICMIISLLSYICTIAIICATKNLKYYAIKLFLFQTISQIICLVPQIVIPFMIIPHSQSNEKDPISKAQCYIYVFFIDTAWFNAILISGLMSIGIQRALSGQGKVLSQKESNKYILVCILSSILLGSIITYYPKQINYGFTFRGVTEYYLCNISINKLSEDHQLMWLSFVVAINSGIFIFIIVLAIKIKKKIKQFGSQGLYIADPIIQIYQFPLVIVILWNVNLVVKILDATELVRPNDLLWSIPWAIIQGFISIEGLIYTIMFLYIYQNIIKLPKMFERMIKFLSWLFCMRWFFRKYEEPQSIKIYESDNYSSMSNSLD